MEQLISVIVPVYNVEKYLDRCVESIVNQTYKNLEIILVDDESPDNSPRMCDEWAKKDSRIKVIHKKNGGVSSARNAALDIAAGDYIAFVDSDDWIEQDMYKKLVDYAVNYDADIVKCLFYKNESNGFQTAFGNADSPDKLYNNSFELRKSVITYEDFASVFNGIYKRKAFENIRFNEKIRISEDLLINYKLNSCVNKKVIVKKYLYHYRINENSVMHTNNSDKFMDVAITADYIWEHEINCQKMRDSLCNYYVATIFSLIYYLIKFGVKSNDENYIKARFLLKNKKFFLKNANLSRSNKYKLFLFFYMPSFFRFLVNRRIKNENAESFNKCNSSNL